MIEWFWILIITVVTFFVGVVIGIVITVIARDELVSDPNYRKCLTNYLSSSFDSASDMTNKDIWL